MRNRWALVALTMAGALFCSGYTQMDVGVAVPETGSLSISHGEVRFDLGAAVYPPAEFPGYYQPVSPRPADDPMTLEVFTNVDHWVVQVELSGLVNTEESVLLPASKLEYSLDGINWYPFGRGASVIVQGIAPTGPTRQYQLDLRLKVVGDEVPGTYRGMLTFTLIPE